MTGGAVGVAVALAFLTAPAGADPLACPAKSCSFTSPTGKINCVMTGDFPACSWSEDERMYSVKLLPNGALDPCINLVAGIGKKCTSYASAGAVPALGYGQTAVQGPYTCLAEAQAITCTVAPLGKGFTINSAGILPVAGTPPPPPPPPPSPTTSSVPVPVETAPAPAGVAPAPPEAAPAPAPTENLLQSELPASG